MVGFLHLYGYWRFSLLGALLNAVIPIGGSIFILSEAIPRLLEPQQAYAPGMALVAVAVNAQLLRGDELE